MGANANVPDAELLEQLREAVCLANEATARLVARDRVMEALGDEVWADLLAIEDNHLRAVRAAGTLWQRFGGTPNTGR